MNFKPLNERILVRRVEGDAKSKGGIFLPESAKEKPYEAEVLAVGTGRKLSDGTIRPLEVKVGDRCLFGRYSGDEVKFDGDEYLILREDDVLAIFESDD